MAVSAAATLTGCATGKAPGAKPGPNARDLLERADRGGKIPVIFDTDIGGDIDDTWALAMLLNSPEVDVKLVVSDAGNATYRARILAKMLEIAERTDIPVGVGIPPGDGKGHQSEWVGNYTLADYGGTVHADGVGAIIDTINASDNPVTVVCIGAVPNIRKALERDPGITRNARFVGMHGAIRRGYGNSTTPVPEANVKNGPKDLQAVFSAPWECSITPLDTCGIVTLKGERCEKVFSSERPLMKALMENYRAWLKKVTWLTEKPDPSKASTTLFDTVAVYMAFSEKWLAMEDLPLKVTDDGMTVIDDEGAVIRCATGWQDMEAFKDLLVERLIA